MQRSLIDIQNAYDLLVAEYTEKSDEDEKHFDMQGSILKDSQAVQIQLMQRWQNYHRKTQGVLISVKNDLETAYASALKRIKGTSKIEYTATELKSVVEGESDYVEYKFWYNRLFIQEKKAGDMVKLCEQRHWVLKELVTTMVHDGDQWII